MAGGGDTLLLLCSQVGTISDIDNLCFVNLVRLPTSRLFFHWISGSKPQLNQVYGNNQILIYPKVFNPYWWFLFALFVQKCKWALNKGEGEGVGDRCHIIGVTSIQIFWSAFLITMIRVWHLSMYWLLIEEKYFRNEMKVVLSLKSLNIFSFSILKINFYCWLLQHTWTKSDNLPSRTSCVEICRLDSVLIGSFDHWLNIYDVFYRPAKIGNQLFYLIF